MSKIAIGKKVPAFSVPQSDGSTFKLADARGSKLVLYFYPKDMTPGCTTESQNFRDLHAAFRRAKTLVLGVSRDSCALHQKFRDREELPFELLSDADEKLCRLFDVIKEKNMYGKQVMGIERSTFLIDADGVLAQEWRKVKVAGHADEVLAAAKAL
ncbi:MAG TPA: peroxiredoxin [Steroidobacteraceae bacterium]|nr:peroxiredoxin [Steroidobacteraceae bacterium]HRX89810.1 peroxiredoxin [Steroidobacteraceae bacterium]